MHPRRTRREGDIEPVIHQDGHRQCGHQLPRAGQELARRGLLEPELHAGHASSHRGTADLDEIAPGQQAVIGHQHQPEQRR